MTKELFLDKILYIGDKIPSSLFNDKRRKFILLGTPKELLNKIKKETREETIRETLKAVEEVFPFVINDNEKNFVQSLINLRK